MLKMGNQDLIARPHPGPTETLRDEIHGLRGAAGKHYFRAASRVDEAAQFVASSFICIRCPGAQCVYAAVHVGVVLALVACDRINDDSRLL